MRSDEIKAIFDQQASSYDERWAKTASIRKRSINPARQDRIYFQEAGAEAGEQFQGSSAS